MPTERTDLGAPSGAPAPRAEHSERGRAVVGWDVGGVNTKVARVAHGTVLAVRSRPYELQRAPDRLAPLLAELVVEVGSVVGDLHAVTMTAELSQMFRRKREGVAFVLDALEGALPPGSVRVYAVDGRFLSLDAARGDPLGVAAANWAATARLVAASHPDALLIDVGTTTTDVIPIVGGEVVAAGRTDPARLATEELVYTGALRTPTEALVSHVPLHGARTGVSAEGFALAGDVHVWRGDLAPADYTVPTPDGRPTTRDFAGERLARVVCADRDLLDDAAVSVIADALADAQVARVADAVECVRRRHPTLRTAVVTGLGAFIATAAARRAGLAVVALADSLGADAARCAPAAAVALLLERAEGDAARPADVEGEGAGTGAGTRLEAVVKLGGGILRTPAHLDRALDALADAAATRALVVVPGGGPFADTVRAVDAQFGLADETAHWMAILAMDQYAHFLAARLPGGVVVTTPAEIRTALAAGALPVLAPMRWLRAADPLPHSWEVTSDSIAAWIAHALGAARLVLVKPAHAEGAGALDPYFPHALCPGTTYVIVPADHVHALASALDGP